MRIITDVLRKMATDGLPTGYEEEKYSVEEMVGKMIGGHLDDRKMKIGRNVYLAEITEMSETILMSSEQIKALTTAPLGVEYRLPHNTVCIQFDNPISEKDIWSCRHGSKPKPIIGVILGKYNFRDVGAECGATVITDEYAFEHIWWPINGTADDDHSQSVQKKCEAIVAFLNADNVEIVRQEAPKKVNAKRTRKGKRPIPEYYITRFTDQRYESDDDGEMDSRPGPSFRFDVRGHFRHYKNGKVTWVRPHQRGLKNDVYRPRDYYDARHLDHGERQK